MAKGISFLFQQPCVCLSKEKQMSKGFRFCRKGLLMGVACGVAMIALAGQTTRAGNIEIVITEDGLAPVTVQLGSGNEGPGTDMNHVVADTMALNAALDANGYDFHFGALGAIANSPGANCLAFVDLTGQVFRIAGPGGAGAQTITIDASQNGFTTQTTLPGTLSNFVTANISNDSGGSQTGTSYFNTSNGLDDTVGAISTAPLVFVSPGSAGSAADVMVPSTAAFSLTSRAAITLSGDTSGGVAPPSDQFTIHTQVSCVPEPASMSLMGIGLPVVFVGLGWLRRRRAAA